MTAQANRITGEHEMPGDEQANLLLDRLENDTRTVLTLGGGVVLKSKLDRLAKMVDAAMKVHPGAPELPLSAITETIASKDPAMVSPPEGPAVEPTSSDEVKQWHDLTTLLRGFAKRRLTAAEHTLLNDSRLFVQAQWRKAKAQHKAVAA